MSRESIAAVKAELFATLTTPSLPDGVTRAYDHEPKPGHAQKPVALTLYTVGLTSVAYLIGVNLYVAADADVKSAAATLDSVLVALDGRIAALWGPSDWAVEWHDDLAAFVATVVLAVGREDGELRYGEYGL